MLYLTLHTPQVYDTIVLTGAHIASTIVTEYINEYRSWIKEHE